MPGSGHPRTCSGDIKQPRGFAGTLPELARHAARTRAGEASPATRPGRRPARAAFAAPGGGCGRAVAAPWSRPRPATRTGAPRPGRPAGGQHAVHAEAGFAGLVVGRLGLAQCLCITLRLERVAKSAQLTALQL